MSSWQFTLLILLTLAGCARAPIKSQMEAMRPSESAPQIADDLGIADLGGVLERNLHQLKKNPQTRMKFGPAEILKDDYIAAVEAFIHFLKSNPNSEDLKIYVDAHFDFFEVYGSKKWGEVFVTSYFEPVIDGAERPTANLVRPLYALPKDLVEIQLHEFVARLPLFESLGKDGGKTSRIRGRIVPSEDPTAPAKIFPYFSRKEIDQEEKLANKGLELVWVDPIDAFFLQIQGSGSVRLNDGRETTYGYANQNGYRYEAIGKFFGDSIPKEKLTLPYLEAHLRSLSAEKRDELLALNPSYVFFRKLPGRGQTSFGTIVEDGRSIATDGSYFPKGALAFLEFQKPKFANVADVDPEVFETVSRFVVDQDVGGAIKGPHRVDLFWGRGSQAKQSAGVMRHPGRLWYLVPKK